jgi:hypothetical protein
MIVEERIYNLHVGKAPEYLKLYEAEGLEVQTRILGRMLGYFSTEIGPLNQVIHLWGYDSFEDRTRRRAELMKDSTWQAYIPKIRPLVISQENKILLPASFSPMR